MSLSELAHLSSFSVIYRNQRYYIVKVHIVVINILFPYYDGILILLSTKNLFVYII